MTVTPLHRAMAPEPAGLTVSFEVTLNGDSRYSHTLRILDALRLVTEEFDTASLDVAPTGRALHTASPAPVIGARVIAYPGERLADEQGYIQILPESRSVVVDGEQIRLTRVEFDLLFFLAEHPRRVFGRSKLLNNVWGYEHTGPRTVDVHIRRLRSKLGDQLVTTVRSVGYRLADGARVRVVRP